jgi:hypothetical protein
MEGPIIGMQARVAARAHGTDRTRYALGILGQSRLRRNIRLRVNPRVAVICSILRRDKRLPSQRRALRVRF